VLTERSLERLLDGLLLVPVGLLLWSVIANAADQTDSSMIAVLSVVGIWLVCWFWLRRRGPRPDDDWKATAYASMPLGAGLGFGAMLATTVVYDLVLLNGGRYVTVLATQVSEHRNKGGSMTYGYDLVQADGTPLPHRLFTSTPGLAGRISVYEDPAGFAPPLLDDNVPLGRHAGFLAAAVVIFAFGVWVAVRRVRRARALDDDPQDHSSRNAGDTTSS